MPFSAPLTGHDGAINAVAFAPGKRLLASAGDDALCGCGNLDGTVGPIPIDAALTGDNSAARAVSFASDRSVLAPTGLDGTVRLWNLDDQAVSARPGAVTGQVR